MCNETTVLTVGTKTTGCILSRRIAYSGNHRVSRRSFRHAQSSSRRDFRGKRENFCYFSHALCSAFAEKQARTNANVLWPVDESEDDDCFLICLNSSLKMQIRSFKIAIDESSLATRRSGTYKASWVGLRKKELQAHTSSACMWIVRWQANKRRQFNVPYHFEKCLPDCSLLEDFIPKPYLKKVRTALKLENFFKC